MTSYKAVLLRHRKIDNSLINTKIGYVPGLRMSDDIRT
jgi:hypothetical protein